MNAQQGTTQDFVIIGGGIVGIATATQILARHPGAAVTLIEKEDRFAAHQTGRNSGVIHAGVYYAPGSMKAQFCREGVQATLDYCRDHNLPVEQCGKMLVATTPLQLPRMKALYQRAKENGLEIERIDATELRRREPNIVGLAGLFVPSTGIVDYGAMARSMADSMVAAGGTTRLGTTVVDIREETNGVTVVTDQGEIRTRYVIACGGLMADRLASMCGIGDDFRIIPFRGEYYRLAPSRDQVVNHLIYPIPDPALPFLGVHLTRMIGGYVTVGPNAVLSMGRESYGPGKPNARDLADMLRFPGFWRVMQKHARSGLGEYWNSISKKRYLALCQRYCPDLKVEDLQAHPPGIRAQAVLRDGTLVHDFLIHRTARTLHVCNAPSPAATSSIPIGRYLAKHAEEIFSLSN
ncbi:L-2-hydroxyglutarate oxidase [Herbaspirillum sp. RTI4]|uniref:L-2-hydroxyglutarate oxidase n=1 Tax=Herbaspirillum sp. RTI4 TaxID=3048640 RepID=UPI002AB4531B|nr:L-2-hydroxyglutarate oxidase [Herbaspirillum sp. RTI4]MDY7579136.1 L-2-hydroxyglutarate oxidase [Herbaspirillum sp. RTI4]MEA9981285.1 L-2-hydroxyglutarate oxidase [Herbaspirillum sp. RTI4]